MFPYKTIEVLKAAGDGRFMETISWITRLTTEISSAAEGLDRCPTSILAGPVMTSADASPVDAILPLAAAATTRP